MLLDVKISRVLLVNILMTQDIVPLKAEQIDNSAIYDTIHQAGIKLNKMQKGISWVRFFVVINLIFRLTFSRVESTSDLIERDLQSMDLTERMANLESELTKQIAAFEIKYIQRITALETKLDIYRESFQNNPFEVIAQMMEMVLKIQKESEQCKTTVRELKTHMDHERTTTNTSLQHVNNKIDETRRVSQGLQDTIINVSQGLQRQEQDITTLASISIKHRDMLENLTTMAVTNNIKTEKAMQALATNNETLLRKIEGLNEENSLQYQNVVSEVAEIRHIYANVTNLDDRVAVVESEIGKKKPIVGFSAYLSSQKQLSGILKLDKILTNPGNGYNKTTGRFTCKVPGLYIFHVSILSKTYHAYIYVQKNGANVAAAFTSTDKNNWFSGSTSVVLNLSKGDIIQVYSAGSYFYHQMFTSFSGALISV